MRSLVIHASIQIDNLLNTVNCVSRTREVYLRASVLLYNDIVNIDHDADRLQVGRELI